MLVELMAFFLDHTFLYGKGPFGRLTVVNICDSDLNDDGAMSARLLSPSFYLRLDANIGRLC